MIHPLFLEQVALSNIAFIGGDYDGQSFQAGMTTVKVLLTKNLQRKFWKGAANELLEKVKGKLEDWHMDKWNLEGDEVDLRWVKNELFTKFRFWSQFLVIWQSYTKTSFNVFSKIDYF